MHGAFIHDQHSQLSFSHLFVAAHRPMRHKWLAWDIEDTTHNDSWEVREPQRFDKDRLDSYIAIVHTLLDYGENPNPTPLPYDSSQPSTKISWEHHWSHPAICQFADLGMDTVVQRLLELGVSPMSSSPDGRTLLQHAIFSGEPSVVSVVLRWSHIPGESTMLSSADDQGLLPIHYCVIYGTVFILRFYSTMRAALIRMYAQLQESLPCI